MAEKPAQKPADQARTLLHDHSKHERRDGEFRCEEVEVCPRCKIPLQDCRCD